MSDETTNEQPLADGATATWADLEAAMSWGEWTSSGASWRDSTLDTSSNNENPEIPPCP